MEKYISKEKVISFFLKIIPMLTLMFHWSGIKGVNDQIGLSYIQFNRLILLAGLVIMFGELVLKSNYKYKIGLNILGHILVWIPAFYAAWIDAPNIKDLGIMFYAGIALVVITLGLQISMYMKNKK